LFCPRCGNEVKFDADTWYFCNPDAFQTRRKFGLLCYNCKAVIFVREDGLLDVHLLYEKRWIEGEGPQFDFQTGKNCHFWGMKMEKILKIKMKGPKEAVERVEVYIEDILSRNTSMFWPHMLEEYSIERIE